MKIITIRADPNLKVYVFCLKHQMKVTHTHNVFRIDLELVHGFRDQSKRETKFNKTAAAPMIDENYWPRMLDNICEFMASILGDTGAHLSYVIHIESAVPHQAEDPVDAYLTVDQEMTYRNMYSGIVFMNDIIIVALTIRATWRLLLKPS
jgi:hypothetical protein